MGIFRKSQWTWKDTLKRIQHIDTIINQIVSGAILLDTALIAAFGALIVVLNYEGLTDESKRIIHYVLIVVCIGGFIINLVLAKSLSRQEYVSKWYFSIFPSNLPLEPHKQWFDRNICKNEYNMDKKQDMCIKKANKKNLICRLGKMRPGFCESWIAILILIAIAFGYLGWISWHI